MSKLSQVKKALQNNPDITIVATKEINHLPDKDGFFSHTVDFYVAPKNGTVSTAEELQALMMSLVPEIKPSSIDKFRDLSDSIELGKLYFDECIGIKNVKIVLTDEDMFNVGSFVDGKLDRTEKIERRVWVRLYPNIQIASLAERGECKWAIGKNKILPKPKGFLSKFLT
jgi:hypothetical protein